MSSQTTQTEPEINFSELQMLCSDDCGRSAEALERLLSSLGVRYYFRLDPIVSRCTDGDVVVYFKIDRDPALLRVRRTSSGWTNVILMVRGYAIVNESIRVRA